MGIRNSKSSSVADTPADSKPIATSARVSVGSSTPSSKSSSKTSCWLVNETDRTLRLVDKVGPAYGRSRYEIPGNGQIEVDSLPNTFYKMLVFTIQEKGEEDGKGCSKKKATDANLTIDTDQIAQHKKIVIRNVRNGHGLELAFTSH